MPSSVRSRPHSEAAPAAASPAQRRLWSLQSGPQAGPYLASCRIVIEGPGPAELTEAAALALSLRLRGLRAPFRGELAHAADGAVVVRPDELEGLELTADSPPYIAIEPLGEARTAVTVVLPALHADEYTVLAVTRDLVAALTDPASPQAEDEAALHADAARWWNEMTRSPGGAQVREYWRARAEKSAVALALPWSTARPDRAREPFRPQTVTGALDGETLRRIEAACEHTGVALSDWLLACWQAAVRGLCGGAATVVGVSTDLRRHEELHGCLGPLSAYLPVRADQPLDASVSELAAELAMHAAAGRDRAEWFDPAAVAAGEDTALAVGFGYAAVPPAWRIGPATATVEHWDARAERFDLRLVCRDEGGSVRLRLEYDRAAADEPAARRILEAFAALAADGARPERAHAAADMLALIGPETAAELTAWGRGAIRQPRAGWVADWIGQAAAARPEAVAVRFEERTLSFGALLGRVNRLARHLIDVGVGPGTPVGVLLPVSEDLPVALLAMMTAGGAYLCLDPAQPTERNLGLLADGGVRVVIGCAATAELIPPGRFERVLLDDPDEAARIAARPGTAPPSSARPQDAAYLIATSGSNGRPKCVVVTRAGLADYLDWAAREFPMDGSRGTVVHSPTGFDFTVPSLYLPLIAGLDLTLLPSGPDLLPRLADELTADRDYSLVRLTPSHARALLPLLAARSGAADAPLRIGARRIAFGGEQLSRRTLREWRELAPDAATVNCYGPSETTVTCTSAPAGLARDEDGDGPVPIGRPTANTRLFVLDASLRQVPVGAVGELYIGGAGLARGYAGHRARTAERFVPDPFGAPGGRLYHSGDLVRWRPDGALEFVGRNDAQVKIRGYRVELGEVDTVLAAHPAVHAAATVAQPSAADGLRLVAWLQPVAGAEPPDPRELRGFAAARLPEAMVPAEVAWLDELPVTARGKVDRAALAELSPAPRRAPDGHEPPLGRAEQIFAEVWAEVLKLDRVGRHENFFALGGDSILAVLIMSRTAERGLRVPLRLFFEHQTVAGIAAHAEHTGRRAPRMRRPDSTALTPIQHWFFEQRFARPGHWNQGWLLDAADLEAAPLAAAVDEVILRHEALGTRFRPDPSVPGGVRAVPPAPADRPAGEALRLIDLSGRTDWAEAVTAATASIQQADPGTGPMLRVALLDGGRTDRRRLALIAHHLAVDTVSWRFILEDLAAAYQVHAGEGGTMPPEASAAPREWAQALREQVEPYRADLDFWLAQSPPDTPALPLDHPEAGEPVEADRREARAVLGAEHTKLLLEYAPASVRIDYVLAAAVALAVREWTGQDGVHLDLEGQGRGEPVDGVDLYRSVGWFTSTTPLLLQPGSDRPGDVLEHVRGRIHDLPRQGLSHGVLRHLDPVHGPALAALPTPQISLNYVGRTASVLGRIAPDPATRVLRPAPETPAPARAGVNRRPRLFGVYAVVHDERLHIIVDYSSRHHERSTAQRLCDAVARHTATLADGWRRANRPTGPADFPALRTDQRTLDAVLAKARAFAPIVAAPSGQNRPEHAP